MTLIIPELVVVCLRYRFSGGFCVNNVSTVQVSEIRGLYSLAAGRRGMASWRTNLCALPRPEEELNIFVNSSFVESFQCGLIL